MSSLLTCLTGFGAEPSSGPEGFSLTGDEVHLWTADLDAPEATTLNLGQFLSTDEKERAGRLKFAKDRIRFVAGRGLLRGLMAGYLGCSASAIRFRYGPFGKPTAASEEGFESVCFNVSHSESLALFVFARERELGVDVERLDPKVDVVDLIAQFFSPEEAADIVARPQQVQCARFFELWTRKEALAKALGKGLSIALRELDVLNLDVSLNCLPGAAQGSRSAGWSMRQFAPAFGYVGALAASGGAYRLIRREVDRPKVA